jgi:hypothetical protein
MRASLWNTVRGGVHNAVLPLEQALLLVERGLPTEDAETGVQQLMLFARRLVGWAHNPEEVAARVHEAAMQSLVTALSAAAPSLGSSRPRLPRPPRRSSCARGWPLARFRPASSSTVSCAGGS